MKLGLYVHIPFCKSKCYYCDFASSSNRSKEAAYVEALIEELKAYGQTIKGIHTITSIFIGGGTPTVLPPFLLGDICRCITEVFDLEEDYEWTVEANPGTITKDHAKIFKLHGVNRVSLGLQACQEHILKNIGRIHTVDDWRESIRHLKEVGICNINTDLMFGLPQQTIQDWQQTLDEVIVEEITHISAYGLIIEEETVFHEWYEQGKIKLPDEEEERQMYMIAKDYLEAKGYVHYEISNWSQLNKECRHNILYWKQGEYIGAGLGAHGYLDGNRYHNTYSLEKYIIGQGNKELLIEEIEVIDEVMQMEEFMFLGLRLVKGIESEVFYKQFGKTIDEIYGKTIEEWIKQKCLVKNNGRVYLTEQGRDISNHIMSTFLIDRD